VVLVTRVVTTSPVNAGVLTDLPGTVIHAAARAGLACTQYIIAITGGFRPGRWEGRTAGYVHPALLRHYFASAALARGIPITEVSRWSATRASK